MRNYKVFILIILGSALLTFPLSVLTNFPYVTNDIGCIAVVGAYCPPFNMRNLPLDLLFWFPMLSVLLLILFRKVVFTVNSKLFLIVFIVLATTVSSSILIAAQIEKKNLEEELNRYLDQPIPPATTVPLPENNWLINTFLEDNRLKIRVLV